MKKISKKLIKKREKRRLKRDEKNKMKEWVKLVKERDNFTCQLCGYKLNKNKLSGLSAHHIVARTFKPLQFDIDNGITLCSRCHFWSWSSAHQSSIVFADFFETKYPLRYYYLLEKVKTFK